jgi:uncharacterized protein
MARLEFKDIRFAEQEGRLRLVFLRIFETYIDRAELERLGSFSVSGHSLDFPDVAEQRLNNKFMPLLDKAFHGLRSVLTGHDAVYVHRNSGIPLFGTLYFGIVDRGTNIIEVKPITGCNIDCRFCSVDEGRSSRKIADFVVEDEYLADEVRKLAEYKQGGKTGRSTDGGAEEVKLDVFINTHGEPLLYANIVSLVRLLREIGHVRIISIITNGTLLTKKLADELIGAGMDQLNLSLNAIDDAKAKELAGTQGYDVAHVLDIARYVAGRIKLIVAPVWIKGVNDEEIPKLISFAKEIGADIGIQNYLVHRKGRKIAKQVEWEAFYAQLEEWENATGMDLKAKEHTLGNTRALEKPFRKGDVVNAELASHGRMKNEMLAAAQGRVISLVHCEKQRGTVKVHILRDKDNVFVGEVVR